MAARNKASHDYKTREKIQTTQLIKRLTNHVLDEDGGIMTSSQVRAAEVLLRKTLPDTQAVSLTGEDGGPITVANVTRRVVRNTNG
jgi:hypothetical protein